MRQLGSDPSSPTGKQDFAGSLLVAHPSLRDPNFRRSVLYLSTYDAEGGALGVILNRPLSGKTAADLLPGHEHEKLLARIPVYLGGPVACDQLSFGEFHLVPDAALRFKHNLSIEDVAAVPEESIGSLRAIIGYAGWSGGQLEGELKQNAWMVVEPKSQFFKSASRSSEDRSWFHIMSSLGPVYKLLAAAPDDPSLN